MNWAASASWEDAGFTGRGILLLRDNGLEEEDRDGASSPCRSDREPKKDSSSCERSDAEERGSRWTFARMARLSEDSEGEAHGEAGKCWALFCNSFSLAEPGVTSCRRLEGSSTGMRLSRRLGAGLALWAGGLYPFSSRSIN